MRASVSRPVRRGLPAAALTILIVAGLPAGALAQASRTWVSGLGDDANPCSRTATCKTFPGAFSKTAVGGEINVLDPGGFGQLNITHSITIVARGALAGVVSPSGNGITVSAGATDRVTLRGLDLDGLGTSAAGIKVNQVGTLRVEDTEIYGSVNGIDFEPTNAGARLVVQDSQIHGNSGDGIVVGRSTRATVRRNDIDDNTCGIVASAFDLLASPVYTTNCGAATSGTGGSASVSAYHNALAGNTLAAIAAIGSGSAVNLSTSEISDNGTGLFSNLGLIRSFGNNYVTGNAVDGNPTSTIAPR